MLPCCNIADAVCCPCIPMISECPRVLQVMGSSRIEVLQIEIISFMFVKISTCAVPVMETFHSCCLYMQYTHSSKIYFTGCLQSPYVPLGGTKNPVPLHSILIDLQTSKCLDMEAKLRQLVKRAVTLQNSSTVERARGGRVSAYAWHRSLQPPISIRKRHPRYC